MKVAKKKTAIGALLAAVLVLPVAAQQVKIENQVKYRRAAYTLMGLSLGNLAAMAQDKKPFNKEEAEESADLLRMATHIPRRYFGEGTDKDTKAKPEIWQKRADFDAKMDKMIAEAAKLPELVRMGDTPAFRKQVAETDAACKACHDEYRSK
jgi:cytochrome c556